MRNIVVPIDFSPESLKGLKLAILFANKMKANIIMIHVLKNMNSKQLLISQKKFEEILDNHLELLDGIEILYKIRKGIVYKEITNEAKYNDEAMIITSTHGVSGFREYFIGTNAFKMVSTVECPIITIRDGECPTKISKIVVPVDRSLSTRQKAPLACDMALLFGAEIHVLGVSDKFQSEKEEHITMYMKQVINYCIERGVPYKSDYVKGFNNAELIINYAKSVEADMIAVMTIQETTIANIFLGTYAEQLVNHSSIPVLFVRPRQNYLAGGFSSTGG